MDFKEAKELAKKQGAVITDMDDAFFVRQKLQVYSPKRFRGFLGISGMAGKEDPIYTVLAGYYSTTDGSVPFSFPLLHTKDIEFAIQSMKNSKRITKALRGVNKL